MKLTNTREHDITIHAVVGEEVKQVTIPGSRQDPEDRSKLVLSEVEVDDALVAAATKDSKAVAAFFEEGWLVMPSKAKK